MGGAGGNAVNNMIMRGLSGVDFMVCNTDAQHLATTLTDNRLQIGRDITQGTRARERASEPSGGGGADAAVRVLSLFTPTDTPP